MLAFSWPLRWAHALALVTQCDTGTRGPMLVLAGVTRARRVLSARALDTEWPQLRVSRLCLPSLARAAWAPQQQQQGWPAWASSGHTGFTLNTDISQAAPARGRRAEKYTGYTPARMANGVNMHKLFFGRTNK